MINVLQSLSLPGALRNEDRIWYNERCLVLLDGSTGLVRTELDAVWFVDGFLALFQEELARTDALPAAINTALSRLQERFEALSGNGTYEYLPSASALFFLQKGDCLQVVNVGDCSALLIGETVQKLYLDEVERFDSQVIRRMLALRAENGQDLAQLVQTPEIRQMLIANRKMMNRPEGYRILAFNMAPVTDADVMRFPLAGMHRIVALSDGFELLEEELAREDAELPALYERLRDMEEKDSSLNRFPRLKKRDDASAVIFTVS